MAKRLKTFVLSLLVITSGCAGSDTRGQLAPVVSGAASFAAPAGCKPNPTIKVTQNCVFVLSPTHTVVVKLMDLRLKRDRSVTLADAEPLVAEYLRDIVSYNQNPPHMTVSQFDSSARPTSEISADAHHCADFSMMIEDRRVPGYIGKTFLIKIAGLVCVRLMLEKAKAQLVQLDVSERLFSEGGDRFTEDFEQILDAVIDSLDLGSADAGMTGS